MSLLTSRLLMCDRLDFEARLQVPIRFGAGEVSNGGMAKYGALIGETEGQDSQSGARRCIFGMAEVA